ncbi:hypothetical protein [Pseudomonas sp. BP8]|uniref:hypothetical protein n=1 Tax=Pseudomonas sp. BP8 TaxID=2817864 RepID=UPI001AE3E76F|nr:hypothetical protein [Pseudomonas sp. BP8]MBP2263539.1 hypothetical protein [Pseudomonas sp. BP8]HDS1735204.1 hypothetical protein [Pseudomonas putida]
MRQADHVAHLPAENAKGEKFLLGVHFVDMTPELINTWMEKVQPVINEHYSRSTTSPVISEQASTQRKPTPKLAVVADVNEQCASEKAVAKVVQDAVEQIETVVNAGMLNQLECAVGSGLVQAPASSGSEVIAPRAASLTVGVRSRADIKWSWRFIYYLHLVYSKWRKSYHKKGESKAVCMVVVKNGRYIPIGMLTLVPDFKCKIQELTKERAYTWYLSDAPREFYSRALGLSKISLIAHALVDYTVQAGIEVNQEATLVLRADAEGGERLKKFYLRIGLAPLPDDHPAISPGRLWSHGGYFKLMPDKSKEFCKAMDVYRASRTSHLSSVGHA